jgi:signal peptidase I
MNNEPRGAGVVAEPPAGKEQSSSAAPRATGRSNGAGYPNPDAAEPHTHHDGPPRSIWREYFESLVVTAIMALFGMTFVVQAVKVPTGSMQNTILIGDHLLVNKFIFAPGTPLPFLPQREIRRGDIIVFKYPGKYPSKQFEDNTEVDDTRPDNIPYKTNYVKRVVGLPGDRIEEHDGRLLINGEAIPEHRFTAVDPGYGMPESDPRHQAPLELLGNPAPTGEGPYNVYYRPETIKSQRGILHGETFQVPEGHYFVMGDNRDNSLDSRYWGFVPREMIVGRAMFVYWSYDESAPSDGNPLTNFIQNTRWKRTGTLVR